MLDSGRKRPISDSKVVTVIGQGTHVTGEVKSQGTVRVEGLVSGHMECDDTIVVQETGKVEADLEAAQIVISGEVRGNVFAHDRLEITTTGKLLGDITAPRVSIAEGVLFEGKCTMKPPSEAKRKAQSSAAPAQAPATVPAKTVQAAPTQESSLK
jgi:cytoskeletal protein CcmA (bactofilin family)